MATLTKGIHPDEKVKAGNLGSTMTKAGLGLAIIFLGLSIILTAAGSPSGGHVSKWARFFHAYVIGWSWIFSISVGMLWITILHHLVRGRWVTAIRRITEAMAAAFPIIFLAGLVFIIPLLAGYEDLYYWAHHDAHNPELNHALMHKLNWLSPTFFSVRYAVYGVLFSGLASYFLKKSRQQDESGDPQISETLRIASGPAMVVFGLITYFSSLDILMTFAPKWYSTMYGVNFWGSAGVGSFSALALVVLWIQRSGRLVHSVNAEHYHDIGKWMYSFTFFWAYTAFSQFMLQWYGNLPEETVWYKYRMFGDWKWVSILMLVGYFAFPFVILMSRWTKRIVPALVFFAVWQLVFHWLDLYWNVMPSYDWQLVSQNGAMLNAGPMTGPTAFHHVGFSAVDITVWLGLVGVLLIGIGRNLKGNLIPIKDPTLPLSLAHEVQ
ncbi:MAG TPA: hypothetical protein VGM90_11410 [Kofleriaceae bacterium]|jgi:hypothetical protein